MLRRWNWNIKRAALVTCFCTIVYLLCSSGYHKYQIDAVISNARPEKVWEFVADFNKMRALNPDIVNFKIISDAGNKHDWRYTVLYTERLSHWPYWQNTAHASYVVTQTMPNEEPAVYAITSKHKTCFLQGLYCLRVESEFKFSALGKDTYCIERIQYECPPFLNGACRRELEYQRKAVFHNLTTIFSKKQSQNY